jgi:hypothetical protein
VIQTNVEGVALDVDVVRVEMVAELRALHKATAQDFGTDFDRWQAWWDKNKDAPEPGAQNAPPVAADPPDGRRARD